MNIKFYNDVVLQWFIFKFFPSHIILILLSFSKRNRSYFCVERLLFVTTTITWISLDNYNNMKKNSTFICKTIRTISMEGTTVVLHFSKDTLWSTWAWFWPSFLPPSCFTPMAQRITGAERQPLRWLSTRFGMQAMAAIVHSPRVPCANFLPTFGHTVMPGRQVTPSDQPKWPNALRRHDKYGCCR